MKRLSIIALSIILSSTTFAANKGSLTLKGIVQKVLSIDVTPESGASQMDLHKDTKDLKVATVQEVSNSRVGYKVSVQSQNKGLLTHQDGKKSGTVTYTMKYGKDTVNLATGSEFSVSTAGTYDSSKDVTVSYKGTPAKKMISGEYSDTVYFTISSN